MAVGGKGGLTDGVGLRGDFGNGGLGRTRVGNGGVAAASKQDVGMIYYTVVGLRPRRTGWRSGGCQGEAGCRSGGCKIRVP